MEGNEIKNAAGTLLDMILQQGREREEDAHKASRKASQKAVKKPLEGLKDKASKPLKELMKGALRIVASLSVHLQIAISRTTEIQISRSAGGVKLGCRINDQ